MVRRTDRRRSWVGTSFCVFAVAPILVLGLAGCPLFVPSLSASPGALSFSAKQDRLGISIANRGGGILTWQISEVVLDPADQVWVDVDVPWLSIENDKRSGTIFGNTDHVFLLVDRTGLDDGTYVGAGVRIASNAGSVIVPVSMTVLTGGGTTPGSGDLKASPTSLLIHGLSNTTSFEISNTGDAAAQWYSEIRIDAPSVPSGTPVQVGISPSLGVIAAGDSTTVMVGVSDIADFNTSYLNYIIAIRDASDNSLVQEISVGVDLVGPAAIAVDPSTLDFSTDGYQLTFRVANVGDAASKLRFAVFQLVDADNSVYKPYDLESDALIADIATPQGASNIPIGTDDDAFINARNVVVTISRDGIEQDLEYRDLWVGAVKGVDDEGNAILDADIAPQKVQVRVQAAAAVEGATNRSRPPSLMRFVFLLRDKRGVAVNAADPGVRSNLSFATQEDGFPLDPDESSEFITGPENLKCNLVLLLDFTGSMYRAGTTDTLNPLEPGEAISLMVEAAKQFVLDVPSTYRIAIMEYHDRNQPSRVVHGFDTNKNALLQALNVFTLPAAEHGGSEIYDALYDATNRLAIEDSSLTLPFDDADVRAVVFVSDGRDTSSNKSITELITFAQESRVRLYPLGYSGNSTSPVSATNLIQLATETGGHTYFAPDVRSLSKLLDTTKDLSFRPTITDLGARTATVQIANSGTKTIAWSAAEALSWLSVVPPSGTIPPFHRNSDGVIDETGVRSMTVTAQAGLAPGEYSGTFTIASGAGNATVHASAVVAFDGSLAQFIVAPQTDDAGTLWNEFQGQVVLTYTSLFESGTHTYLIEATFPDSLGKFDTTAFQKDGVFYGGDSRGGQVSLSTTGIQDGKAEVFVRADYIPRNITQFRFRFILDVPESAAPSLSLEQRADLLARLRAQLDGGAVEIASQGLLSGWRLIAAEGNGIFSVVTEPDAPLPYGTFGDLLKLSFDNLGADDGFTLGFRVDTTLYYSPATSTSPSLTKYFLYPCGVLNPKGLLTVGSGSSTASPSLSVAAFLSPLDPEAANVWDRDGDSWTDFDDADPDDKDIGDRDHDGVPDLDDPAPLNPTIP